MAYRLPIIVRTAALILLQQYKASSQQCLRAFEWSLHLCREQLHKRELYYVVILLENYVFICAERSCDASTPHPLLTPHMFTLSQRKQELWMHGVANFPCWHDHVGKVDEKKMLFVIWKAKALVLRNSGKLESRSEMNVWSGNENETWLNIWKTRPPKHQKVFCKEAIFVWSLFGYII